MKTNKTNKIKAVKPNANPRPDKRYTIKDGKVLLAPGAFTRKELAEILAEMDAK